MRLSLQKLLIYAVLLIDFTFCVNSSAPIECFDPNQAECQVQRVLCNSSEILTGSTNDSLTLPTNLNIDYTTVGDESGRYLLSSISWQASNNHSLQGFVVEIQNLNICYQFNVSSKFTTTYPPYRLEISRLLEFDKKYHIIVHSLSMDGNRGSLSLNTWSPLDQQDSKCLERRHWSSSTWVASFRKVIVNSKQGTIYVQFTAAPHYYCFEKYELRLLDSDTSTRIIQSAIIGKEDLKTDNSTGKNITYGEFEFKNINEDVIPSVIPIEKTSDGKCLCRTRMGCGCLSADGQPIRLKRGFGEKTNHTLPLIRHLFINRRVQDWLHFASKSIFFVLIFGVTFSTILLFTYRTSKYFNGIQETIELNDFNKSSHRHRLLDDPDDSFKVLLVYSHDCAEHEQVVRELAKTVQENCLDVSVRFDEIDLTQMEKNRTDYVDESVQEAEMIVFLHSYGTYQRIVARQHNNPSLERLKPGNYDDLFEKQYLNALSHPNVISTRFAYTPSNFVISALSDRLQFVLPDNISYFLKAVSDEYNGTSLNMEQFTQAIEEMTTLTTSNPSWFESIHEKFDATLTEIQPVMVATQVNEQELEEAALEADNELESETSSNSTYTMEPDDYDGFDPEIAAILQKVELFARESDEYDEECPLDSAYLSLDISSSQEEICEDSSDVSSMNKRPQSVSTDNGIDVSGTGSICVI